MKKAFFAVLILLATTGRAGAQQIVRCLQLAQQTAEYYYTCNPDSILIDTCANSPTFQQPYSRQAYLVSFFYDVIHLDSLPADSIIPGGWEAIDTTYPRIRADFKKLDSICGGIRFKMTSFVTLDTIDHPRYSLYLGSYQPESAMRFYFDTIPSTFAWVFGVGCQMDTSIIHDSCLELAQLAMIKVRPELRDSVILNPDSTMIDTCGNSPFLDTFYSHRSWYVQFQYASLQLPPDPDSILEVPWSQISLTPPGPYAGFANLDSYFGGLILRKVYPAVGDSTNPEYNMFEVIFNNYEPYDTILNVLSNMPAVARAWWTGEPIILHPNESVKTVSDSVSALRVVQVDGSLYVIDGQRESDNYSIFDICGRNVRSGQVYSGEALNTNGLTSGLYFLRIQSQFLGPFCFQN